MTQPFMMNGVPKGGRSFSMQTNDAAIAGGMAFLISELEKLDPTLHEPLTSTTYNRDVDITVGGGWVDHSSAIFASYGVAGGSGTGALGNGAINNIGIIQADVSKEVYPIYPYERVMSVKYIDMQRGDITGRSLEQIYNEGIRLDFDKYMDLNAYVGLDKTKATGLLNNPNVVATTAAANGVGDATSWDSKTPDQILEDVNQAITAAWAETGYDPSAIANHVLIPPKQYTKLVSQKVSEAGNISVLEYLLQNNIARNKGTDLFIGECKFCEGAGTGGTDRMMVYRKDKKFLEIDLAQPLTRVITQPNAANGSYDSLYAANVGVVKMKYTQPVAYVDGI